MPTLRTINAAEIQLVDDDGLVLRVTTSGEAFDIAFFDKHGTLQMEYMTTVERSILAEYFQFDRNGCVLVKS